MNGFVQRPGDSAHPTDGPVWTLAPYPVLAADLAGVIRQINNAARVLFSGAEPGVPLADAVPGWLARAQARLAVPEQPQPDAPGASPHVPGASPHAPDAPPHTPGAPPQIPGGTTPAPGGTAHAPGSTAHGPGGTAPAPGETPHGPGGTAPAPGETPHGPGGTPHGPGGTAPAPGRSPHAPAGPPELPAAHGTIGGRAFEARPTHWTDGGETIVVWWLVEAAEHPPTPDSLRAEHERAVFLMAAANELTSLDADRCLDTTVRLAARHLADLALVIIPMAGRGHQAIYCGPDGRVVREDMRASPAEIPGVAEALQGFPPVPSRWIDPALVPGPLLRHGVDEPGSMVVTALPGPGAPAGALVLVRSTAHPVFSDSEESLTRQFAARAGTAMSAARLYAEQASITEILMRDLLPPRTRDLDGVRLAARYRPSGLGEQVGGDFYDLFPAADDDHESLIVLGDVCGKGLEAAVLTGKIRNALQVLLPLARDHHQVLDRLNEVILLNGDPTKFVTLVLASVQHHEGRVRMRLTSAGHPPPLILRAGGGVEEVPTVGTLIGVIDKITTETVGIELGPGETCLLHTDGVTEARGGRLGKEMFGDERLRAELAGCAGMPPDALVERVQMLACDWVGDGYHDDMAVIAITPRRERTPTERKRDP